MSISIVFLLAIVAATSARQVCTPGESYKNDCNWCTCSLDGMTAECTLMECYSPDFENTTEDSIEINLITDEAEEKNSGVTEDSVVEEDNEPVCTPNSFFKIECNECRCSEDGKHAACTLKLCIPDMYNKDGSPQQTRLAKTPRNRQSLQLCTPGASFKQYCNSCFCSKDGTEAACTRMFCPPEVFNPDGTFKRSASK